MIRRVTSQAEFDAAVRAGDEVEVATDLGLEIAGSYRPIIRIVGNAALRLIARESSQPHVEAWGSSQPHVVARESSQPHVVAWESSQPHVVARESSQPHVVAWGSSQPHVEAWGSSQPHVEAWESSQPHVVARGLCQLMIRGAVKVIAAATVAICILGGSPRIEGGGFIQRVDISTPQKWCDFYGVEVKAGIALVFKGVRDNFYSPRGACYAPGTMPSVKDWDRGAVECGPGGLHFSPTPAMTLEFIDAKECKHFLACPIRLEDIATHPDGQYPQKIKARGMALPCWEVDRRGRPVEGAVVSWPPAEEGAPHAAKPAPKRKAPKKTATKVKPRARRKS